VDGYEPCCQCKNCVAIAAGESLDVIEIDGASNNSVDEVRELRSHIMSVPISSKYKVYIIDEVHMLSISAFNALLKTLEEPPEHVVFVLATTEAHKVPVTIRSRCQHIPFHRIDTRTICERLSQVCAEESIKFQPEALWEIARQADGAMRDGLSMLEQVAGSGDEEVAVADVEAALGQPGRSSMERWLEGWRRGKMETFCELDRMLASGASPQRFLEELFALVRNLWLVARWNDVPETLDVSGQEREYLKREAPLWKPGELEAIMRFLAELLPQTRMGLRMDVLSGLLMARMFDLTNDGLSNDDLKRETSRSTARQVGAGGKTASVAPSSSADELRGEEPRPWEVQTERPRTATSVRAAPPIEAAALDFPAPTVSAALPPDFVPARGQPCPGDRWSEAMAALHDEDFVLYCGLLDARALTDEDRLILEMPCRYGYEVLGLERNRSALRRILSRFWPDAGVILCHEGLSILCSEVVRSEGTGRKNRSRENFEYAPPDGVDETEKPGKKEVRPVGGVPFDGLVREVTRWMRGEVILVRRGADEEADDVPVEE
jgi:DNA polymerase-3 subunit gamma/tau